MKLRFAGIHIGLAVFMVSAASAQDAAVVGKMKAKLVRECAEIGEKPNFGKRFVTSGDFNGDSKRDYVFDYGQTNCGRLFCGSAGCVVEIHISDGNGHREVFSENLRNFTIRRSGNRDILSTTLHGGACRQAGVANCEQRLGWNGTQFAPIR